VLASLFDFFPPHGARLSRTLFLSVFFLIVLDTRPFQILSLRVIETSSTVGVSKFFCSSILPGPPRDCSPPPNHRGYGFAGPFFPPERGPFFFSLERLGPSAYLVSFFIISRCSYFVLALLRLFPSALMLRCLLMLLFPFRWVLVFHTADTLGRRENF